MDCLYLSGKTGTQLVNCISYLALSLFPGTAFLVQVLRLVFTNGVSRPLTFFYLGILGASLKVGKFAWWALLLLFILPVAMGGPLWSACTLSAS